MIQGRTVIVRLLPPSRPPIEVGSVVRVKKTANNQVSIFESAVVETVDANASTVGITIFAQDERDERRSSPRSAISVNTRYGETVDETNWRPVTIWDLSEGGACLISAKKHEPGDQLFIDLPLTGTIRVTGVVRVCSIYDQEAKMFAIGIEFVNTGEDTHRAIRRFLLDHQMTKVRTAGSSLFKYIPHKPICMVRGPRR
jgi:hypothetical protein